MYLQKPPPWNEEECSTQIPVKQDFTFINMREEGVLFTLQGDQTVNGGEVGSYWVVG